MSDPKNLPDRQRGGDLSPPEALRYSRTMNLRTTGSSEKTVRGNWGELVLVAMGFSCTLGGLLPASRQRISPSRGQHIWPSLQEVWTQEMLLEVEQVHSLEQVLSVYQLSPTCGVWPHNGNLEARHGLGPSTLSPP